MVITVRSEAALGPQIRHTLGFRLVVEHSMVPEVTPLDCDVSGTRSRFIVKLGMIPVISAFINAFAQRSLRSVTLHSWRRTFVAGSLAANGQDRRPARAIPVDELIGLYRRCSDEERSGSRGQICWSFGPCAEVANPGCAFEEALS